MSESIGSLFSTKVPSFSDAADIQEALRIYHYGAPSGTGVGEYDINNTDPESLENPSIAYFLHDLQSQLDGLTATSSVPLSAFTVKGSLLVGTGASTYLQLPVGSNGYVLTANSATDSGLEWALPTVTPTNTVTFTNKTLTAPVITTGINPQTVTSYTAVLSDASKVVEISNSSAITFLVPTNATAFPVGTSITINQVGTGQITIAAVDSGTTTINSSSGLKLRTQWSVATLIKRDTEKWVVAGDLSA